MDIERGREKVAPAGSFKSFKNHVRGFGLGRCRFQVTVEVALVAVRPLLAKEAATPDSTPIIPICVVKSIRRRGNRNWIWP